MSIPSSAAIADAARSQSPLLDVLELVAPKLQQVEEMLRKNLSSDIRTIHDVGEHILDGGGKRLRPALLLLCSQMAGYQGRSDVTYASVIELIHTATLVHDDIIDDAELRRGKTSINYKWGNHLTVLVGDYLYTHAMKMALSEGDLDIVNLLCDVTIRMTEGEILGLEKDGRTDLTAEDYFEIVSRKTAALFSACAQVPGMMIGARKEQLQALYDYGHYLGMSFQLVDDILDFTSERDVLGKPTLSDLKEGKLTLPLILALPHATTAERNLIARVAKEKTFGETDPSEIVEIAHRYDGIRRSREKAAELAGRCRSALAQFPSTPAREALEAAVDFVVHRDR